MIAGYVRVRVRVSTAKQHPEPRSPPATASYQLRVPCSYPPKGEFRGQTQAQHLSIHQKGDSVDKQGSNTGPSTKTPFPWTNTGSNTGLSTKRAIPWTNKAQTPAYPPNGRFRGQTRLKHRPIHQKGDSVDKHRHNTGLSTKWPNPWTNIGSNTCPSTKWPNPWTNTGTNTGLSTKWPNPWTNIGSNTGPATKRAIPWTHIGSNTCPSTKWTNP